MFLPHATKKENCFSGFASVSAGTHSLGATTRTIIMEQTGMGPRLNSAMLGPEPGQASVQQQQQVLAQVRLERVLRELEKQNSIKRRYRKLLGQNMSPGEIAHGLRDAIHNQITSGYAPAIDRALLEEAAAAETRSAREMEWDAENLADAEHFQDADIPETA